jgi:hypothetical protein
MSISRFFLVVETCDMNIYELYERLLSIMIPKIQYIGFLKNDTLLNNFIVIESDLLETELYKEIQDILPIIGYYNKFSLLRPIEN